MDTDTNASHHWRKHTLWGGLLVLLGGGMLVAELGFDWLPHIEHYWPFLLVLVGVNRLLDYPHPRHVSKGLWLIFVGLWLFVCLEHLWGLTFATSWPILIIAFGTALVFSSYLKSRYPMYARCRHEH